MTTKTRKSWVSKVTSSDDEDVSVIGPPPPALAVEEARQAIIVKVAHYRHVGHGDAEDSERGRKLQEVLDSIDAFAAAVQSSRSGEPGGTCSCTGTRPYVQVVDLCGACGLPLPDDDDTPQEPSR